MRFGRDENRDECSGFCGIESLRLSEAHPSLGGRDQSFLPGPQARRGGSGRAR